MSKVQRLHWELHFLNLAADDGDDLVVKMIMMLSDDLLCCRVVDLLWRTKS